MSAAPEISTLGSVAARYDWYLLEAEPRNILLAKREIAARRAEVYIPMTWRRVKLEGRAVPHAEQRLPGNYAFVWLRTPPDGHEHEHEASVVARLRGVRRVYTDHRGRYEPVRKSDIDYLKGVEAEEHYEAERGRQKDAVSRFKRGAKVRILRHDQSAFVGLVGEFLYSAHGEASVAMDNGMKIDALEMNLTEAHLVTRLAG